MWKIDAAQDYQRDHEIGQTIKIGYFSQENEYMDESERVIDYVKKQVSTLQLLTEDYRVPDAGTISF